MEFKVKEVSGIVEKSAAQIEEELLTKHEEQFNSEPPVDTPPIDEPPIETPAELKEEDVLSYLGKRYNKEISSFDELMAERKEAEELPEDVGAFLKYKRETGRGIQDYLKLQEDFDTMNPDVLLKQYFKDTEIGLDDDDIDALMEEFKYDEDFDDDSHVKKAKIAKKKVIAKAKEHFNSQKEKYKQPLESSGSAIPNAEKEEFEAYKQYIQQAKNQEEDQNRKRDWFLKKTEDVFSQEFKGFEFNIDDKKVVFSPGDAAELKKLQSNPANFINKYLDESGMVSDAAGYHRSLAIAMNPEKFAKFFYEQGQADATEDVTKKIKNINMSERRAPEASVKGGMQVRQVNPDTGNGLKIKSAKRI
jgi:rubrerythrin